MKLEIKYHEIKSDHLFATPEYDRSEYVDVKSYAKLEEYIIKQKDQYGNYFEKTDKNKSFGFDYVSISGGVKIVKKYEIQYKKI